MIDFARTFKPFSKPRSHRRRALVTAFGRFGEHATNASATIARALLGETATFAPRATTSEPDDPAAHVSTMEGVIDLPTLRSVEIHVVVLPSMWDLAPLLAVRSIEALRPDVVLMNGIGATAQAIAVEAAANNRAALRDDASARIRPRGDGAATKILPQVDDPPRALSLDVERILGRARSVWSRHASTTEGGLRFDAVAPSVELAPAREENAYLCNQLAYLVDRALAFPDRALRLLRGVEHDVGIDLAMGAATDAKLSRIPRGFVHWPSALVGAHVEACVEVLRAMLDAQLAHAHE